MRRLSRWYFLFFVCLSSTSTEALNCRSQILKDFVGVANYDLLHIGHRFGHLTITHTPFVSLSCKNIFPHFTEMQWHLGCNRLIISRNFKSKPLARKWLIYNIILQSWKCYCQSRVHAQISGLVISQFQHASMK